MGRKTQSMKESPMYGSLGINVSVSIWIHMSFKVRRRTFGHVRPAKFQVSLRIRAVWPETLPGAFGITKDAKFLHADNEDPDKTVWMHRLIWVFVGSTCQWVHLLALPLDDLVFAYYSPSGYSKKKLLILFKPPHHPTSPDPPHTFST